MKILIIFLLMLFSFNTYSQEISWADITLGNTVYTYPQKIIGTWQSKSKITEEDCKTLDMQLEKSKSYIERCKMNPGSIHCENLKMSLDVFKQIDPLRIGSFDLWSPLSELDQTKMPFSKEIKDFESDVIITYTNNSFLKKFENIIPLDKGLDYLILTKGQLKTGSKFTECDLLNGKIKVESQFKRSIKYTEALSENEKELLYQIYLSFLNDETAQFKNEAVLVQAALIGYSLGKSIKEKKIVNKKVSIKKLFNSFFEEKDSQLVLKIYSNQFEFNQKVIPDETLTKEININWSNL